jgi:ribosomal protein S6--L-glutamate ligase
MKGLSGHSDTKMILSFHPNIVAHKNILCAGRLPNDEDLAAICRAEAVILPQGCSEALYRICRKHCRSVFPNYDVRFDFPGKLGQARLFQEVSAPFPRTYTFDEVSSYHGHEGQPGHNHPLGFPCVFKFDWGGEGEEVYLLETDQSLKQLLEKASRLEQRGQKGFLIQEYVPCGGRSLRIVIVGDQLFSYWRRQPDSSAFLANLKAGAVIDHGSDPELQEAGKTAVKDFCSKTGVNLAGFDLLFRHNEKEANPFFLEVNYFFGRRGLGGSLRYYKLVDKGIERWLEGIGLSL